MAGRYNGHRVRGWTFNFGTFSISELSQIVGVRQRILHAWRDDCHLPGNWKDAGSFTSRDVAEILTRHHLQIGGLPLNHSDRIGCFGAQHVLWHALTRHERICRLTGVSADIQKSISALSDSPAAANDLTGMRVPHRYIADDCGRYVIDLARLADHLVTKARKPLFEILVSDGKPGRRIVRRSKAPCYGDLNTRRGAWLSNVGVRKLPDKVA